MKRECEYTRSSRKGQDIQIWLLSIVDRPLEYFKRMWITRCGNDR